MSNKTEATTKFYMDQANKIVDVLSEILPKIYYSAFNDQFDVFMNNLWEKPDENHGPILDKMALEAGETPEVLEKINWNKLSKERKMEWLKRMDVQALLKALRFRPESLDIFCEKNSLVKSKMINVLQAMINWRNYGVGHKTIFKYEKMDEKIFKLNILEPVWEFYDLLSRYYTSECETLHKTLQEIEIRMKYNETSIERLVELSKKSEDQVKEALKVLKIYSDPEGKIKGEDEYKLAENIRRLSKKESKQQISNQTKEDSQPIVNRKRILIPIASVVVLALCIVLGIKIFSNYGYSRIPNVVGLDEKRASYEIQNAGLKMSVKYADELGQKKGIVIKQDEKPNTRVKKDKKIHIYVCSGKVTSPNLKNKNVNEAKQLVSSSGLKPVMKKAYSDKIKKNYVISQYPSFGKRVDENSKLLFTVSKGKEKIKIPYLNNKSLKSAKRTLQKLGLQVNENQEYSNGVTEGRVIRTSPSEGHKITKGKTITVVISKGSEPTSNSSNNVSGSSNTKPKSKPKKDNDNYDLDKLF